MRAAFTTFGCKLNQFETEALASAFAGRGFLIVPADQEADVYVVNTCTVTSRSEQKARRMIRALSRRRPAALLLITGCYAQLGGEELARLGVNVRVVPQDRKASLLDEPLRPADPTPSAEPAGDPFRFQVGRYRFHSRAFLKIQDGCDCGCAYCRVPLARGPSVSLAEDEVIRRIAALQEAGYREVVLTGVNLSAWRGPGRALADLIEQVLARTSTIRLRLSSIEPETIDARLVDALRDPRICAHFHLPIQSGSEAVLNRMRRRYGPQRVREAVARLRGVRGDPFLAADVLVGFPGERDGDFEATCRLLEELRLSQLHVFPFSPRPGTAAAGFAPRVPERVRDERAAALLRLSRNLHGRYLRLWEGREETAVLEEPDGPDWIGLTGNYLRVRVCGVPPRLAAAGEAVRVRIENAVDPCAAVCLPVFHAAD